METHRCRLWPLRVSSLSRPKIRISWNAANTVKWVQIAFVISKRSPWCWLLKMEEVLEGTLSKLPTGEWLKPCCKSLCWKIWTEVWIRLKKSRGHQLRFFVRERSPQVAHLVKPQSKIFSGKNLRIASRLYMATGSWRLISEYESKLTGKSEEDLRSWSDWQHRTVKSISEAALNCFQFKTRSRVKTKSLERTCFWRSLLGSQLWRTLSKCKWSDKTAEVLRWRKKAAQEIKTREQRVRTTPAWVNQSSRWVKSWQPTLKWLHSSLKTATAASIWGSAILPLA